MRSCDHASMRVAHHNAICDFEAEQVAQTAWSEASEARREMSHRMLRCSATPAVIDRITDCVDDMIDRWTTVKSEHGATRMMLDGYYADR